MYQLILVVLLLVNSLLGCTPQVNGISEADKKEIRQFSRTLYTAAYAIEVIESSKSKLSEREFGLEIARVISKNCLNENPKLVIDGRESTISWNKVPESVKNSGSCKMEYLSAGQYRSTVIGNESTDKFTSVNGD
jgi:hypothetical protein